MRGCQTLTEVIVGVGIGVRCEGMVTPHYRDDGIFSTIPKTNIIRPPILYSEVPLEVNFFCHQVPKEI